MQRDYVILSFRHEAHGIALSGLRKQ